MTQHYSKDGILTWFDNEAEAKTYRRKCRIAELKDWRTWALLLLPSLSAFLVGWLIAGQ